jgi:UDP-N-acetyl-D-galactosamine dehydrogenase
MGSYVAGQLIKAMIKKKIRVDEARVLVMGLAFKEDCPDLRNTRVVDIIEELREYNVQVDVLDPWVNAEEAEEEYGLIPVPEAEVGVYDAMVLAVAHHQFKAMPAQAIRALGKPNHLVYDLKYVLSADESDIRL